jgi:hypothetical protein
MTPEPVDATVDVTVMLGIGMRPGRGKPESGEGWTPGMV